MYLDLFNSKVYKYFNQLEAGAEDKGIKVIGSPIYPSNGKEYVIGKIVDYDNDTGLALFKLFDSIHYKVLLKNKVPLNYIVFHSQA